MKDCLAISVYASFDAKVSSEKLFERVVYFEPAVKVDFQSLIASLRFMYGNTCVITFELSNY